MPLEIDFLGEGRSDEAVARTLISAAGHIAGRSYLRPMSGRGKASLDGRLEGLNRGAAVGRPVLVIRDLDRDAPCAPALAGRLLARPHSRMLLRIAVHAVEAWLIADGPDYARFCGVPQASLPAAPEGAADLKPAILDLAVQHRRSNLARHAAECRGRGLADWQMLGEWHAEFATEHWRPIRAAETGRAPSLTRALERLGQLSSVRKG